MARPYEQFIDPETGDFTPEYMAFSEEVEKLANNFDCNQIALAMLAGKTPEQCATEATAYYAEICAAAGYNDPLDHDYSMNG